MNKLKTRSWKKGWRKISSHNSEKERKKVRRNNHIWNKNLMNDWMIKSKFKNSKDQIIKKCKTKKKRNQAFHSKSSTRINSWPSLSAISCSTNTMYPSWPPEWSCLAISRRSPLKMLIISTILGGPICVASITGSILIEIASTNYAISLLK